MSEIIETREAVCGICGNTFSYPRRKRSGGRNRFYCDECMTVKGKRLVSIYLSTQDFELLDEIKHKLGIDNSETIRTCIRVYNALLKK